MAVTSRVAFIGKSTLLVFLFAPAIGLADGNVKLDHLNSYNFSEIASTADGFDALGPPRLSNRGEVAYWTYTTATKVSAIYYSDGGSPRKIIESGVTYDGGILDFIDRNVDINNVGVIAFSTNSFLTTDLARFGVFTLTLDGEVTQKSPNDPTQYFDGGDVSLNDYNQVAYTATNDHVYSTISGSLPIFFSGGGDGFASAPRINNSGEITFSSNPDFIGASDNLFVYKASQMTEIDATAFPSDFSTPYLISQPDINSFGDIAYVKQTSRTSSSLFLSTSGHIVELPVSDTIPYYTVAINDHDVIAYEGLNPPTSAETRLFVDGVIKDVAATGDQLFRKEISSVEAYDINERNQLALYMEFTDGSSAIVLATPVPEPSSYISLLVGIGLVLMLKGRTYLR